jgi:hypothetical protein
MHILANDNLSSICYYLKKNLLIPIYTVMDKRELMILSLENIVRFYFFLIFNLWNNIGF